MNHVFFLVNHRCHSSNKLIAAVMTLTIAHFCIVQAIYYFLDSAIAGIVLILGTFSRILYVTK
jgi:hypothetical protein